MFHVVYKFFDTLEDRIRGRLSRTPILYALFGGIGVVLFWRGVWHSADYFTYRYLTGVLHSESLEGTIMPWWDGPLSLVWGALILLSTGLLVSDFIGNEILLSGLKGEKKLTEKTVDEIEQEANEVKQIRRDVRKIAKSLRQKKTLPRNKRTSKAR